MLGRPQTREPRSAVSPHRRAARVEARYRRPVVLLALAWGLPVVAYLLHVAWIVPVVVLAGAAALLRAGRTLLDRLVLAGVLLYGALAVAGLLLSVWPWHLHPVAVGVLALTALTLFAHLSGRALTLPRPRLADALTLGAAALVGAVLALPLVRADDETRLAMLVTGEDGFRHFAMMETTRLVGGYPFLHADEATRLMFPGDLQYPPAGHLLFGLLDGFLRSSTTELGSSLDGLAHYLGYAVASYAVFALVVVWAVQRLAQPLLTPARRLVLVGVAVAYLLSDRIFFVIIQHFTPQILGLALVVVLVAVLARPPARTGEALWLVAALLAGIGFTYYLYLPPVGLAVLIWLWARRRLLAAHRVAFAGLVAGGLVALLPVVNGLSVSQEDALRIPAAAPSVDGVLAVLGISAAGLLRAWPVARWRAVRWMLGAATLGLALMYLFQRLSGGEGGSYYYANKMIDLIVLLLVLASGASLAFLPAPARRPATRRQLLAQLAPAGAIVVALAAASGLVVGDSPLQPNGAVIARGWAAGAWDFHRAQAHMAMGELGRSVPPGTVTVIMREDPQESYVTQQMVSVLLRQYGEISPGLHMEGLGDALYYTPGWYDRMVEALADHPLLIAVDTPRSLRAAQELRDRHPELEITVVQSAP